MNLRDEWDEEGQIFMELCRKGEYLQVEQLMKDGFNPNSYLNYENWSPLFISVKFNQLQTAKVLLQNKANIDCLNLNSETPLMHACINGNYQICELLIDEKCNIDQQNDEGATALSFACYYGHEKIAQKLINSGAKVDTLYKGPQEIGNVTPLQICQKKELNDTILLIKAKL